MAAAPCACRLLNVIQRHDIGDGLTCSPGVSWAGVNMHSALGRTVVFNGVCGSAN